MATEVGINWTCDVETCKQSIFTSNPTDDSPVEIPNGWHNHVVDGLPILCCPDHHKAFMAMLKCFIQDTSIDIQGLIDAYENDEYEENK